MRPTILRTFLAFSALTASLGLQGCLFTREVRVHATLPREVLQNLEPQLIAAADSFSGWFWDAKIRISGAADTSNGLPDADIYISHDPFWLEALRQEGRLAKLEAPAGVELHGTFAAPDSTYLPVAVNIAAIAYQTNELTAREAPERWKQLTDAKHKGRLTLTAPRASAATETALLLLMRKFGKDFVAELLRGQPLTDSEDETLFHLVQGAAAVAVLPLRHALLAQTERAAVRPVYPLDGPIPVPVLIGVHAQASHPELARTVAAWFHSVDAQLAFVRKGYYPAAKKIVRPDGAREWEQLEIQLMRWQPTTLPELTALRAELRSLFRPSGRRSD